MKSFFGGDLSMAHFSVHYWESRKAYHAAQDACGAEYRARGRSAKWLKLCKARDAAFKAMKEEYRAAQARLKEVGFKTPYFHYRVTDEAGKAAAKAKAEAYAKEWGEKTGLELTVSEGCSL